MGCTRISTPEEHGGLGVGSRGSFLVAEEIAGGAPGIAGVLLLEDLLSSTVSTLLGSGSTQAAPLDTMLAEPAVDSAWGLVAASPDQAVRLPSSGLDVVSWSSSPDRDARVERTGAGWRLQSVRLRTVANAAHARHLFVFVADADGVDLCYLDADTAGVSRTEQTTSGLRAHGFADLLLDDVTIPAEGVVQTSGDGAARTLESLLTRINIGVGFKAAGLARQAHQVTVDYCTTRVQGGRPIIEHDSVAASLWAASSTVSSIRSLATSAAERVVGVPGDLRDGLRVRSEVERTLAPTVVDLLALLGAYGVSHEYPLAKMYRDATTLTMSGAVATAEGVFARVSTF